LILRNSHGSFCAAILITSAISGQWLALSDEEVTPPKHWLGVGVCDFAVDPNLPADRTALIWLPHLDTSVVLVAPAPQSFTNARSLGVAPAFERRGPDGDYLIVDGDGRLPLVLIAGASVAAPAAVVMPLDADFAARVDAALRLWRLATGRPKRPTPNRMTLQRRKRLGLTLRALDGHLAGETYRVIAQVLFGSARVPAGAGWKTHDLRDRTIRLVRTGVRLMHGGYLDLLRHPAQNRE
jgi:hypothetical protein